jgi:threonine dehydrogenase-like Zn-dependent dehydrogenase
VGKHPHKLALLHQLGMATVLLNAWRPRLADIVVEATGSTAGLALAMESIRPRGTLVLKSTVASPHTLSLAPLVINEITVVGSRCGRFPPALQALAHGQVTVAPLIDRVYPLAEGLQALAHAARPGTRKIVLRMF